MQWSLFLLILMGHCSFFVCEIHKYHFIEESKTWEEAKTFCRERHTDLATVPNMTFMEKLRESTQTENDAWIGLYSISGSDNRRWHWSMPGVELNETELKWADNEPDDQVNPENCGGIEYPDRWADLHCSQSNNFLCYNETNQNVHLIDETKNWWEAQHFCRQQHTDLASGAKQFEGHQDINGRKMWMGLFRDTWRWSDESNSSYRNWEKADDVDKEIFREENGTKNCAVTQLDESGTWSVEDCNKTKPFFCHSEKERILLIHKNMTWEDALNYCRNNHHDLVSITNRKDQNLVHQKIMKAQTQYVWLGLRYSCALDLWFWVNDKLVSISNWDPEEIAERCNMAAAMDKNGEHKWVKTADNNTYNFICSLR